MCVLCVCYVVFHVKSLLHKAVCYVFYVFLNK